MRRLRSSALGVLLAAACLAQTAGTIDPHKDENVRRVGGKLRCLCGCPMTVESCDMPSCHYADPGRAKVMTMSRAGKDDATILKAFTDEEGLRALAAPPVQGAYLLGWVMPGVMLLLGLSLIVMFMRKFLRRPTPAGVPEISADAYRRYQDRIERDLAKME